MLQFLLGLALAKEVQEGRCPFAPGTLKSRVETSLDYSKMYGNWINIYDEREITNSFLCLSAHFEPTGQENILAFKQANSIYPETREALREQGDPK